MNSFAVNTASDDREDYKRRVNQRAAIQGKDFTDLLFEGRNKKYGAYRLRRLYDRHLLTGTLFAVIALLLLLLGPVIIEELQKLRGEGGYVEGLKNVEVEMPVGGMPTMILPPPPSMDNTKQLANKDVIPQVKKDSTETAKPDDKSKASDKNNDNKNAHNDPNNQNGNGQGGNGNDPNNKGNGQGGGKGFKLDSEPLALNLEEVVTKMMVYPEIHKIRQNQDPFVWVTCHCSKEGVLSNCHVTDGKQVKEFNDEALRLMQFIRMQPAFRNGHPIDSEVKINIPFVLKRGK